MKQEQQQAIALMRYGAIAPLVTGLDDRYPSMQAYYEEVSAKGLTGRTDETTISLRLPLNAGTWIIKSTALIP